jgi:alpha-N-arabinofuranosidase
MSSANHDMEAAEALSTNLIQKFYTVSDKSNFGQVKSEICSHRVMMLTTEVGGGFTGCYFALYAAGNGAVCENPACFTDFHYTAKGVQ